jgi:dihydroxyacetone kinase-like predicted kinase
MLTVAHDMAAAGDPEEALQAGRDSLRRGPSLLPALRDAGVVDSGGYALTLMVAGALAASRGVQPPPEEPMTGEDAPLGDEEIRALVPPGVEVEVTPGAPPPWWWLIAAE